MGTRSSVLAIDLIVTTEVFAGITGQFAKLLASIDQTLENAEKIFDKDFPDLKFDIRPPKEIVELEKDDEVLVNVLSNLATSLMESKIPFLSKFINLSVEWLTRQWREALVFEDLGYAKVNHPPIGSLDLIYYKNQKVAWVVIDLEDLPQNSAYNWKNEHLYMIQTSSTQLFHFGSRRDFIRVSVDHANNWTKSLFTALSKRKIVIK